MRNTLIIKTGAAGDVVRTTSLLNVLEGNIYWVADAHNIPLLPNSKNLITLTVEEAFQAIQQIRFEQVISLEENEACARLAREAATSEMYGIYLDKDKINYTDNAADWFDMSRVSKLGIAKANILKAENKENYQSHIFKMIGRRFNGEPYQIFRDDSASVMEGLIGIERRSGSQWPDKQWWGYDQLVGRLKSNGVRVRVFEQKKDIRDYLRDIAECSYIVSGDTLAMHIALAYKKNCTAIFNCTSPWEIYDYGCLKKLVSPLLYKYFYSASHDPDVIESIPVEDVYNTLPIS